MPKSVDALQLLKHDHTHVRALIKQLSSSTTRASKKRHSLLEEIAMELKAHTRIEEEIFYPAFRQAARNESQRVMVAEAFEEHRAVEEMVLPDLEKTDPTSETFSGRAKVLKELVEHHAAEEEKEMFPMAKKLFSKEELQELGARMKERKEEILHAGTV